MKKTTMGEKLFYLIRDEILDQTGQRDLTWSNIGTLFNDVSGNPEFAHYIKGATSIYVMRRLLRFWKQEHILTANESQYVRQVSSFIKQEVFPSLDNTLVSKLSRAVIQADQVSKKDISPSVKKFVIRERTKLTCYLCGCHLDQKAKSNDDAYLTIEHLWPTSIGGDSIEGNLLPACLECQEVTKNTASWEWLNAHNFVFSISPSKDELDWKRNRRIFFAKHYYEATKLANSNNLSLKEAFLKIGPIKRPLTHNYTSLPVTFFDLKTF